VVVLNLPDTVVLAQQSDPDRLIETVVDHWEGCLRRRLDDASPRPLGLATGRTMEPFYAALVQRLRQWSSADLTHLREGWLSFNLDEYVGLPALHAGSFRAYMHERLGEPLGLASAQLCLPDGAAVDPAQEALHYALQLRQAGGIGIQLLGLGSNGHVGFNEPPCSADAPCRCIDLSPATRDQNAEAFGGDLALVPRQAITLGMADILAAQEVHLIVTGAAKAAILQRLLTGGCDPALPASWLLRHPRVRLWVDDAALGVAVAAR